MVGALHRLAHEGVDLVVALHRFARRQLVAAVGVEGRLGEDFPGQAHAGAHLRPVVLVAHIVEQHFRRRLRIGRGEADRAARPGAHRAGMGLVAVAAHPLLHVVRRRQRQEVVLDVGPAHARPRADEAAGFEMVGRTEPGFERDPAHADQPHLQQAGRRMERDRPGAGVLEIEFQMVLQVCADAGQIVDDPDAVFLQMPGRADAGEHEKLRRVDRAAAQDDFAAGVGGAQRAALPVFDAARAPSVQDQPRRQRAARHMQVGAPARRLQIGVRRAPAPAAMDRHVHRTEAFLAMAVHVGSAAVSGLDAGFDKGRVERVGQGSARGVQRPRVAAIAVAAIAVAARAEALGLAEIGQHLGIGPAGRAAFGPAVVVQGVAADIGHAVDRGGTADHPAARAVQAPPAQMRLGLGPVGPVIAPAALGDGEGARHLQEDAAVAAAGFEQQHGRAAVLGQPAGQHTARRARADHDIVKCPTVVHPVNLPRSLLRQNGRRGSRTASPKRRGGERTGDRKWRRFR